MRPGLAPSHVRSNACVFTISCPAFVCFKVCFAFTRYRYVCLLLSIEKDASVARRPLSLQGLDLRVILFLQYTQKNFTCLRGSSPATAQELLSPFIFQFSGVFALSSAFVSYFYFFLNIFCHKDGSGSFGA